MTVGRDLGLHLMRFVMMEHQFPREEVLRFLHNLADALSVFVEELERYAGTGAADLGVHPRLALDHGLSVHRASLRWVEQTIRALSVTNAHVTGQTVGFAEGPAR